MTLQRMRVRPKKDRVIAGIFKTLWVLLIVAILLGLISLSVYREGRIWGCWQQAKESE